MIPFGADKESCKTYLLFIIAIAALRRLTIYDTESSFTCKPILRSCPKMERLTLCDCTDLNDEEFFQVKEDENRTDVVDKILISQSSRS